MKNYTITVNGTVYEVICRRRRRRQQHRFAQQLRRQHRRQLRQQHRRQQHRQAAGSVEVTASVPGKVFKVEASARTGCKSR